jgi:hypothetical protein
MKTRSVEAELTALDDLHQKYKFMEQNLAAKKDQLQLKVPDLKSNLEILGKLKANLVRVA